MLVKVLRLATALRGADTRSAALSALEPMARTPRSLGASQTPADRVSADVFRDLRLIRTTALAAPVVHILHL